MNMKRLLKSILPGLLLVTLATPGLAENREGAVTLSPFVGGYLLDHSQPFENRPIFGVRAGYNFTKNLGAEAMFGYSLTEMKEKYNSRETDLYRYGVDILYHFMPDNDFVPFVEVGGGVTNFHVPNTPSVREPYYIGQVNYGVGFKYFVADNVALRADVRHAILVSDPADNNLEYSAGLTFQFGGKEKPAAPVATCEPCPKAELMPTPPATETKVEEAVLEPVPVAEPTQEKMKYCVSLDIEFDINKADIRPQYHDEVAKVGDFMKKYPTTTAVIEGYSDEVGSDDYNMRLSQQRAESVVKSLEENFGIDSSRLSAKGYGKSKPIADNSTDAGKQKNRRIDAIIDCALDVKELAPPPERLCITLKVEFATDSAVIAPLYYDEINKVGEYMKKYPTTTAVIEGHTDNLGSPEHNMKLSQLRAENVVNYLVEKFEIERSRLSAKGYGSTRRIAYNNTAEGRQKNRRINAVIDCVIKK